MSSGPVNPHALLEITNNMHQVRGYLTDELQQVFENRRRNVEVVVKAMTNVARIESSPDHPEYIRGQKTALSEVEHANRDAALSGRQSIVHTPLLRPMEMVPLEVQEDWMARLGHQRLKATLLEGAAQGWSSDIHGHPIPGIAHGAEFGYPDPRKPKAKGK